jgi:hypothetical protein
MSLPYKGKILLRITLTVDCIVKLPRIDRNLPRGKEAETLFQYHFRGSSLNTYFCLTSIL